MCIPDMHWTEGSVCQGRCLPRGVSQHVLGRDVSAQWGVSARRGWCLPRGCGRHPLGPDAATPPRPILRDTVNKRAVRIPLECILVSVLFYYLEVFLRSHGGVEVASECEDLFPLLVQAHFVTGTRTRTSLSMFNKNARVPATFLIKSYSVSIFLKHILLNCKKPASALIMWLTDAVHFTSSYTKDRDLV